MQDAVLLAESRVTEISDRLKAFVVQALQANTRHFDEKDEDNPTEPPFKDELVRAEELIRRTEGLLSGLRSIAAVTEDELQQFHLAVDEVKVEAEEIGVLGLE